MSPKIRNWQKRTGWQKAQAQDRHRSSTSLIGEHQTTIMAKRSNAPSDSWWTKAQSRDEFDRLAEARSREAGWVGKPLTKITNDVHAREANDG